LDRELQRRENLVNVVFVDVVIDVLMTTENWGFFRGLSMFGSFGAVFLFMGAHVIALEPAAMFKLWRKLSGSGREVINSAVLFQLTTSR
jgi:hypothetical protein